MNLSSSGIRRLALTCSSYGNSTKARQKGNRQGLLLGSDQHAIISTSFYWPKQVISWTHSQGRALQSYMAKNIYLGRDKELMPSIFSTTMFFPLYQTDSPYNFLIYVLALYGWYNGHLFCPQTRLKGYDTVLPSIRNLSLHYALMGLSGLLTQTSILSSLGDLTLIWREVFLSKFTQCKCTS